MVVISLSKQKNSTHNLFYIKRKKNHKNNAVGDLDVIYSACYWEKKFSQLRKDVLLVTLHFLPNCILFNYLSKSQNKKRMKINSTFPHFFFLCVQNVCWKRHFQDWQSAPTQLLIRYLSNQQTTTFQNVPWAKAEGASLTDTSLGHCSSNSRTRACEMFINSCV